MDGRGIASSFSDIAFQPGSCSRDGDGMHQFVKIKTDSMMKGIFIREGTLLKGIFISRPNRFLATVRLEREMLGDRVSGDFEVNAHVADPGRLEELLVPGRRVHLAPSDPSHSSTRRKTAYDLVLVDYDGILVSVDSRVPNEIVFSALQKKSLDGLRGYSSIIREAKYGESRLDFRLSCPGQKDCLIEVKSVTLVQDGRALFPDAPTIRGARHMKELMKARGEGIRAFVLFIIQRNDAREFSPNDGTDPVFGMVLRDAFKAGVEVWAYTCEVTHHAIQLYRRIPVVL